jgi:dTDP-4-amino-4,6-dideoxygalactose transaminase
MPIAEDIAKKILCLPLYWKLDMEEVEKIINVIKSV